MPWLILGKNTRKELSCQSVSSAFSLQRNKYYLWRLVLVCSHVVYLDVGNCDTEVGVEVYPYNYFYTE